ncbi:MAG: hypothetical protein AAF329_20435 [Cyanobacteria bacterium P01_A01_bin.17]
MASKRWYISLDRGYERPVKMQAIQSGKNIITTLNNLLKVAIATNWRILEVDQQKLVDWINEQ